MLIFASRKNNGLGRYQETKTLKTMKYEINFAELGQIFTEIAKAEQKANAAAEAEIKYRAASQQWEESGYLISAGFGMNRAFDEREKAIKAACKQFVKVAELMGCKNSSNYEDVNLMKYAKSRYEFEAFICCAKRMALEISKFAKIYND